MTPPTEASVRPASTDPDQLERLERRLADPPPAGLRTAFSALATAHFRYYVAGVLVTSTGGWVQRIAQDWLVLSLTGSPTAVGITTMCQFVPSLVLGLGGGVIADRFPKRRVLSVTMTLMGLLAGVLAVLVLTGAVQVWHVDVVALLLGMTIAVDNPTRQSFVSELAPAGQLRSAVSMVSSTFQTGALLGPAIAGVLLSGVGSGWAFALNGASYVVALALLVRIPARPAAARSGGDRELRPAVDYARHAPTVRWPILLAGVLGMFTLSLPVSLSAFAKDVFHSGSAGYGLLSSALALGAIAGAVVSARQPATPRLRALVRNAALLAVAELLCALAPSVWTFVPLLVVLGACSINFITTAQAMIQLTTPPALRGRVLSVYLLVFFGGGAAGGPLVGALCDHGGPQLAMLVAGVVSGIAAASLAVWISHREHLRLAVTMPSVRITHR
ncbi:MFS transporter [Lapillicoccus jejuensis]|uniref:Putative MFS family arabinose efflux permease n=1 Tax=Lapillicoccus jejuensis TaxID=402171 RepID=A0A542E033_9MICO|nr:MFS transporter [Lapillicoccus jejuensis]TQJ08695.1 putative MFS family arabinose efflux permease [Lapillicoccus jejuensis]